VVGSRPITAKEVKEAQDRLTLTLAGRWETASAVGSSVADIVTYGLPEDYYATYAARIRGVQPELAARTSRKLLTPGKQVWVVIGDRAKIEAGVRSLGLGEPRLLAAEGSAAK
jgi:zinc protease